MTCNSPRISFLSARTLVACVLFSLLSGSRAADFTCATRWAAYGTELQRYQSISATQCQTNCEANPGCTFFTVWENPNDPTIAADRLCVLQSHLPAVTWTTAEPYVKFICGKPDMFVQLNAPAQLAIAGPAAPVAATGFTCATKWAAYGVELKKYQAITAKQCQTNCEADAACTFFTAWENPNNPALVADQLCVLQTHLPAVTWTTDEVFVKFICGRPGMFALLKSPDQLAIAPPTDTPTPTPTPLPTGTGFTCATKWAAYGVEVQRYQAITASQCQTNCDANAACTFFTAWENPNDPTIVADQLCVLQTHLPAVTWTAAEVYVKFICGRPGVFALLNSPVQLAVAPPTATPTPIPTPIGTGYTCATKWAAYGVEVQRYQAITAVQCQTNCDANAACTFFTAWENPNNPALVADQLCVLQTHLPAVTWTAAEPFVKFICGKPGMFALLQSPAQLAIAPPTPTPTPVPQGSGDVTCASNWAAYGTTLDTYESHNAVQCQQKCQANAACTFFTVWEDPNNPSIINNPEALCVLQSHLPGITWAAFAKYALITCANPTIFPLLNAPVKHIAETGTLIPGADTGEYGMVAYSTGLIAVSVTMLANTDKILIFGRPQDTVEYPPQPGMAVPGAENPKWAYPSVVVDVGAGTYEAVTSQPGSPFCAHTIHLSNGAVLICGGDDEWNGMPGDSNTGGHKACRTFSPINGVWTWTRLKDMLGGNWYPSILEIPPNVGGSTGTCGLVLGGVMAYFEAPASHVSMACEDGTVFSIPVGNMGPAPIPFNLGLKFPGAVLLPVGAPPAAPTIFLTGHYGAGNVVRLNVDIGAQTMAFASVGGIPGIPTANAKLSSGLIPLAFDIAGGGVDPADVVLVAFGGEGTQAGEPSLNQAYRIRPLVGGPVWETEAMPSAAHERMSVVLPNGKIVLVGGARQGHAGGLGRCCYSVQSEPILKAWIYDPYAPAGARFTVDNLMTSHLRFYHSNAWLGLDGDIIIAGGDQTILPDYRPGLTMERYTPLTLRKAMATKPRPQITSNFGTAGYNAVLVVQITGGYVSRCSLVKPAAITHNTTPNQKVIMLRTTAIGGASISVQLPGSTYIAQPGWYLVYCWDEDMYTNGRWLRLA